MYIYIYKYLSTSRKQPRLGVHARGLLLERLPRRDSSPIAKTKNFQTSTHCLDKHSNSSQMFMFFNRFRIVSFDFSKHDPFQSSSCFVNETEAFLQDHHHDLRTAKLVSKNQWPSSFAWTKSSYANSCFKCIDVVPSCMLRNYVRQQQHIKKADVPSLQQKHSCVCLFEGVSV